MTNPLTENINPSKLATDYVGDLKRLIPTIDVAFVGSLIKDVFGVESPVYLPTWWQGREFQAENYPDIKLRVDDLEYERDAPVRFGEKVFGAFWLQGGGKRVEGGSEYQKYNSYKGVLETLIVPDFLMPVASIVDFTRPKTVIKTPTIGGAGSVKEIYGLEDWNISIKGIILPDPDRKDGYGSVARQMEVMQSYHEAACSIGVEGNVFFKRGIYRMVTESLTFSPVQGKPNMMQYSIEAVSDEDILMEIKV